MCECKSYNLDVGTVPEVELPPPYWSDKKSIMVDDCIADVVQELWKYDIQTLSSCCGHNRYPPSIILKYTKDVQIALTLLNASTGRSDFLVGAWRQGENWLTYFKMTGGRVEEVKLEPISEDIRKAG